MRQAEGAQGPSRQTSIKVCQVPGCTECLGRAYNLKRRLCDTHMRAVAVLRSGHGDKLWRFCQQHARLELLQCFEGCRRSCKVSLLKKRAHACGKAPAAQRAAPPRQQQRSTAAPTGCSRADTALCASAPQSPCWTSCGQQPMELCASPSVSPAAGAPAGTSAASPCSSQLCSTSCWALSSEGVDAEAAPHSAISKADMVTQLTDAFFDAADDDDEDTTGWQECTSFLADSLAQQLLAKGTIGSAPPGPGTDLEPAQLQAGLPVFASAAVSGGSSGATHESKPGDRTLASVIDAALLEAAGAPLAPHAAPAATAAAHNSLFAVTIPTRSLPATAGAADYGGQIAQLKQQYAQLHDAVQSLRSLFSLEASFPHNQSAACGSACMLPVPAGFHPAPLLY